MQIWLLGIVAAIFIQASLILQGVSAICLLATSIVMILFMFYKALTVVGKTQAEHAKLAKH